MRRLRARRTDHPAPDPDCGCGIHVCSQPEPPARYYASMLISGVGVFGVVEGWGRTVPCERGWLVEHARPTVLYDLHPDGDPDAAGLARAYGVPLVDVHAEPWGRRLRCAVWGHNLYGAPACSL